MSAANANDSTMFAAVLDDIPPIRMPSGRRRRRPGKVHADKAYDHRRCRAYLRRRGIRPRIARRMIESSTRLGRHRWTIERTGAWLGGWRRLRIRYERDSERFYALAMLACSVICFNASNSRHGEPFGNVHLPRSTRTWPPSRSSQRPRGRVVLPIFIRQGWPKAMSHLPWNNREPLCAAPFSQVAPDRRWRSNRFF
jgi:transposase